MKCSQEEKAKTFQMKLHTRNKWKAILAKSTKTITLQEDTRLPPKREEAKIVYLIRPRKAKDYLQLRKMQPHHQSWYADRVNQTAIKYINGIFIYRATVGHPDLQLEKRILLVTYYQKKLHFL